VPEQSVGASGPRYDFYLFPDNVEARVVLDRVGQALHDSGQWTVARAGGAYWRTWLHGPSGQEVGMVAAGLRPLVLSVGLAGANPETAPRDGAGLPAARRAAERVAGALGARPLTAVNVLQLFQQARRADQEWARTQQRIAELTAQLSTRTCPSCAKLARAYATTCRLCGYRFTRADDLARDARSTRAAAALRQFAAGSDEQAAEEPGHSAVPR
jgi:hypothetical protein